MRTPKRAGISLIEVSIGTLLVGGVLATTLHLVAPTVRSTQLAGDRLIAATLADDMTDEIMAHPFADATNDNGLIGPGAGETGSNRSQFDDVDDYNGWSATAQTRDGDPIPGIGSGWVVRVSVAHANPDNPTQVSVSETGVKRIVVQVSRNGVLLAERVAVRTRSIDESRRY